MVQPGGTAGAAFHIYSLSGLANGHPEVASDGKGYLAIWTSGHNMNGFYRGATVTPPATVQYPTFPFTSIIGSASVVFNGTNYLVVSRNKSAASTGIVGRLVSTSGSLQGSPFTIVSSLYGFRTRSPWYHGHPALAYGAGKVLMVWTRGTDYVESAVVTFGK